MDDRQARADQDEDPPRRLAARHGFAQVLQGAGLILVCFDWAIWRIVGPVPPGWHWGGFAAGVFMCWAGDFIGERSLRRCEPEHDD